MSGHNESAEKNPDQIMTARVISQRNQQIIDLPLFDSTVRAIRRNTPVSSKLSTRRRSMSRPLASFERRRRACIFLMDLPGEIRNMIYEQLLLGVITINNRFQSAVIVETDWQYHRNDVDWVLSSMMRNVPEHAAWGGDWSSLRRVSRLVRCEVDSFARVLVFPHINVHFRSASWISSFPPTGIATFLVHMTIRCDDELPPLRKLARLSTFTALKSLDFYMVFIWDRRDAFQNAEKQAILAFKALYDINSLGGSTTNIEIARFHLHGNKGVHDVFHRKFRSLAYYFERQKDRSPPLPNKPLWFRLMPLEFPLEADARLLRRHPGIITYTLLSICSSID